MDVSYRSRFDLLGQEPDKWRFPLARPLLYAGAAALAGAACASLGAEVAPHISGALIDNYLNGPGAYVTEGTDGIENAVRYLSDPNIHWYAHGVPVMAKAAGAVLGAVAGLIGTNRLLRRHDRRAVEACYTDGITDAADIAQATGLGHRRVSRILERSIRNGRLPQE